MRHREMKSVHSLLGDFLQRFQEDDEKSELFLQELWPEIVGEQLAMRTRPHALHQGRLQVAVSNERWKKELKPLAESLRGTINRFWGVTLVKRISFVVGHGHGHGHGHGGHG